MKILISIIAVVIGLAGLAMTGCGLIFTFAGMQDSGMLGLLMISVPALLAGLGVLYGAWRLLRTQVPKE